jgi:hypothetical protein
MQTTENKGLEAVFDWVQVTFQNMSHLGHILADDSLGGNFLPPLLSNTILTRTQEKLVEDYLRGRDGLECGVLQ